MDTTTISSSRTYSAEAKSFIRRLNNKWLFNFFLWWKLPAAFWSGVRVRDVNFDKGVASVPFKRLTQNPFRSTYFASLAMAAEMATGILAMAAVQGAKPSVSMLVTGIEADFTKKATSRTYFSCEDGQAIFDTVERAQASGEPVEFTALSTGRLSDGTEVARFRITWSFKSRS
jgi:hypothetical protein